MLLTSFLRIVVVQPLIMILKYRLQLEQLHSQGQLHQDNRGISISRTTSKMPQAAIISLKHLKSQKFILILVVEVEILN